MTTVAIPADLVLMPVSRWPTVLPEETVRTALSLGVVGLAPPAGLAATPAVSIIIATHDNRVYLTLCLRSVLAHSPADCEVIVVDNGCADGTAEDLRAVTAGDPRVRVIANDENRGFAGAANQGVAVARGARLVLLNDDTIVPPGWLPRLVAHLDDDAVGIVGSVSNRAGNEAQVETSYRTYTEMVAFAAHTARAFDGRRFDIRTATMFCVALRAETWRQVGCLDEQFELGMFEDEDYAMRVRAAGYRVVCAEDAFVHHFGQASLGKLAATDQYGPLFHANRQRWQAKWQCQWQPYRHRETPAYHRMLEEVRRLVDQHVPAGETVLVATKGDDALLRLDGRQAWHFPQLADGGYAGFHPADSNAAILELEELRSRGSQFLLLPSHVSWWLTHYTAFREYLETSYAIVSQQPEAGVIYTLKERRS
jgi:GT2 family glycosyltransferase